MATPRKKASFRTPKRRAFTSWSYSRYRDWNKCAAYAAYKHLDRIPEPPSAPMQRGIEIAQESEDYLKGKTSRVPASIKSLAADFRHIRKQKTKFVEEMWAFTADWVPCDWRDWDNCWVRIKIDSGYIDVPDDRVMIFDGKSGKYKPYDNESYMEQLSLYIVGASQRFDNNNFAAQLLYTDHGIKFPEEGPVMADRKEATKMRKAWERRVRPMFNDTRFNPSPGRHCQWCPYSKAKGGPCKY